MQTMLLTCWIALVTAAASLAQPVIQFDATNYTVAESAGAATLSVQRTGDASTRVSVDYATADGTATNGLKYLGVHGVLTFEANETNKVLTVPIINNGLVDNTRNFRVILTSSDVGAVLGTRMVATVSISDNDSPIKVEFPSYEVWEDEATVLIGVLRRDDGDFAVSVDYATSNITAVAGEDYVETRGRLTFAAGDTLKLVTIPMLNDALKETSETFRFTLTDAVGGTLAVQKSATVMLKDIDPGVGFMTAKYYVHENEGVVKVTVCRGNDLVSEPFAVGYATVDSTALADQDYVAANGLLAFAAGELTRSFEVALLPDGILEADENFRVVLSNPTGGVTLGAMTNLVVVVCDSTGMAPHGFAAIHPDADGIVKLTFSGGVSKRFQPFFDLYPVEVSTNLVDWQALALLQRTNSAANEFTFFDTGAEETGARFYRVPPNHFTSAYPRPTGPYPVGKMVRMMHDTTRRNRYGISTNGSFAATILYPAAPRAGQHPAPWFEEALARDTSSSSYWAFSGALPWLDRVPYLSTYSFPDAPLAETPETLPVVLFSPGFTVDRSQDFEKLEGLASHGYLVISVDHFDALNVEWPDGFYYSSATETTSTVEDMKDRVRDLVFVLAELTRWNQDDPQFAGRIALDKIGAMGMSWGGPTIAELAQKDERCRAVVLLDPGGSAGSLQGFSKPSLTMHAPDNSDQSVFAASKTNAVWFQISNTDHGSFANYVVFSSPTLAANREAQRTIRAYALSFFDKWLKGLDDHLYESSSPSFPRVINFRKK